MVQGKLTKDQANSVKPSPENILFQRMLDSKSHLSQPAKATVRDGVVVQQLEGCMFPIPVITYEHWTTAEMTNLTKVVQIVRGKRNGCCFENCMMSFVNYYYYCNCKQYNLDVNRCSCHIVWIMSHILVLIQDCENTCSDVKSNGREVWISCN